MNTEMNLPSEDTSSEDLVVTVNIFGADYALRGGADPEYIRQTASRVDSLMREIAERVKHASVTKIAVLSALQLADQLGSLQSEKQTERTDLRELAEQTDSLLSRLDQTLLEVVE